MNESVRGNLLRNAILYVMKMLKTSLLSKKNRFETVWGDDGYNVKYAER